MTAEADIANVTPRPATPDADQAALEDLELAEVREELRRLDGKARDLLVAATLAVTASAAAAAMLHASVPLACRAVFGLAIFVWLTAVVRLLLVIRPVLVEPKQHSPRNDLTVRAWRLWRLQVLGRVLVTKYRRVQRAVDTLLVVLALTALGSVMWLCLALFG